MLDHPVWHAYKVLLRRHRNAEATIRLYETVLGDLWAHLAQQGLAWDQVTAELVDEWLKRPCKPGKHGAGLPLQESTAATYGGVGKRFYAEAAARAWLQGGDPLADWRPPSAPAPRPRALPLDAVARLLLVVDPRIRMMLLLGYHQGLRVGEITRLRIEDLALGADPPAIFIRGKGGRNVWMELSPALGPHLRAWLLLRPAAGPLIPNHRDPTRHLNAKYAAELLAAAMRPEVGDSGHALRRTGATQLARQTRDPYLVQAFLRHASVATQASYVGMSPGLLAAALAQLPDPSKETR